MDTQLSQSKLILLYIIREKDMVTPQELSDFVMFRRYMDDYFAMESYLRELLEQGLVLEIQNNGKTYYTLHPDGIDVVEFFRARIPHSIREDIRAYAQNSFLHNSPLLEPSFQIEQKSDSYLVKCRILDYDTTMLRITMDAASEEEAQSIGARWKQKGLSIYWNILKEVGNKNNDLLLNENTEDENAEPGTAWNV